MEHRHSPPRLQNIRGTSLCTGCQGARPWFCFNPVFTIFSLSLLLSVTSSFFACSFSAWFHPCSPYLLPFFYFLNFVQIQTQPQTNSSSYIARASTQAPEQAQNQPSIVENPSQPTQKTTPTLPLDLVQPLLPIQHPAQVESKPNPPTSTVVTHLHLTVEQVVVQRRNGRLLSHDDLERRLFGIQVGKW